MAIKESITKDIEAMEIGDTREYPAIKVTSIRSLAYTISFKLDRVYQTATDREKRIVTVTRTK